MGFLWKVWRQVFAATLLEFQQQPRAVRQKTRVNDLRAIRAGYRNHAVLWVGLDLHNVFPANTFPPTEQKYLFNCFITHDD